MRSLVLVVALLAFGPALKPAAAVPVPAVDLPQLTRAADVIVVGRVEGLQLLNGSRPSASFNVAIARVLKGSVGPARRIAVRLDVSREGYGGVAEREYGMLFLRRNGGFYTAADPYHPSLVASPTPRPADSQGADALSAVSSELAAVLATPAAALLDPDTGVQDLAVGARSFQAEHVYYEAATALKSVPYEIAGDALRAVSASAPVPARLWALTSLLQMGDAAELEALRAELLDALRPVLIDPGPELQFSVLMLAQAMDGRISSPEAVPTLAALLRSSSVEMRRAAAAGLGQIATKEVIGPLARIALNDTDQEVRYFAVSGLAAATDRGAAPALHVYQAREEALLRDWRGFAASYRE